jgi:hypothetical protein
MFSPEKRSPLDILICLTLGVVAGIITTVLWSSIINALGISYPKGAAGISLSILILGFPIIVLFLVVTSIIMIALNHLTDGMFRESKNGADIFWITAFIVTLLLAIFLDFA